MRREDRPEPGREFGGRIRSSPEFDALVQANPVASQPGASILELIEPRPGLVPERDGESGAHALDRVDRDGPRGRSSGRGRSSVGPERRRAAAGRDFPFTNPRAMEEEVPWGEARSIVEAVVE